MKHIRNLKVENPHNTLSSERAAETAYFQEERGPAPKFFRGLIVGMALSVSFYTALYLAIF